MHCNIDRHGLLGKGMEDLLTVACMNSLFRTHLLQPMHLQQPAKLFTEAMCN